MLPFESRLHGFSVWVVPVSQPRLKYFNIFTDGMTYKSDETVVNAIRKRGSAMKSVEKCAILRVLSRDVLPERHHNTN